VRDERVTGWKAGGRLRQTWQQKTPLCRYFTGATGLEPATSGVTGRRSNQLNYAPRTEALYPPQAQSFSLERRRRGTRLSRRRAAMVATLKIPRPTAPPTALANSRFAFCVFGRTSIRIPGWRALHLSRTGASRGVARSSPGGRGTVTTSSLPRIALPSIRRRKSSRSSTSSGSTLMRTSTACSAGASMCLPPSSARAARTATLAFARTRPVVIACRLRFWTFRRRFSRRPRRERTLRASVQVIGR
jgi:hypothetical protein